MSSYVGLSRRRGGERRVWDMNPKLEHRGEVQPGDDRRRHGTNSYFLVVGNGGIDRISVICLIAMVIIVVIVAA